MVIGIDGNVWYCSNGLPLPDARSKFVFERILKDAVESYRSKYDLNAEMRKELREFWNFTPE